jgi:hydroxymethylbilane synthase
LELDERMTVLRLGTRGSPLALAQAHEVRARLIAAGVAAEAISIEVFKTTGDRIQDRPLSEVGGKGLFTKELEEALLAGTIDAAVHSMKDMATRLPDRLAVACVLEREDVRDGFVSLKHKRLADLPKGAVFGTSSLRRQAQMLRARPDLQIVQFRGNVQTRLEKLAAGVAEGTLLAVAGLNRLGAGDRISEIIGADVMLPAAAQGAIGIEIRADDHVTAHTVAALDHQATHIAVVAERAFLGTLDGSCKTPIAALAVLANGQLTLRGEVIAPDGRRHVAVERVGAPQEAQRMGADAGAEVLVRAGADLLGARV